MGSKKRNSLGLHQAGTVQPKAEILCISPHHPQRLFCPRGQKDSPLGTGGVTVCGSTALCLLENCKTLNFAAAPRSSERARTCWKADAHVGAGPARTFQAVTQRWSLTAAWQGHCRPSHVTAPSSLGQLCPGTGLGLLFFCFIRILLRSAVSGSCLCSGLCRQAVM